MGAPRGRSGVQRSPNAGQSQGRSRPATTSPQGTPGAVAAGRCEVGRRSRRGTVRRRRTGGTARGGPGRSRGAGPGRARRRRPARTRPRSTPARAGCRRAARHARTGSRPRAVPRSSWHDRAEDALEQVDRLRAGDDDRHAVPLGQRLELVAGPSPCRRARRRAPPRRAGRGRRAPPPGRGPCARGPRAARSSSSPSRSASRTAAAAVGAVVSKPTAKKTTVRSGFFFASARASSGE